MPENHVIGVLPARWGSTRFPGKPLHLIAGKPLIQHVWDRCQACQKLDRCLVATDDERIAEAVSNFGGEAVMTRDDHPTGTDRIAEAVEKFPETTAVVNIQGDEPLVSPDLIDELAGNLIENPDLPMITAANPMDPENAAISDPNVVKVTIDQNGLALYFSRSAIPFVREKIDEIPFYRHKGIYGFQRDFLLQFVGWRPSPLEKIESLEQLRALENGARIKVIITDDDSPGIDTPEQAAILDRNLTCCRA